MPLPFSNQECLTVRLSALGDAILTTGVLAHWHDVAGLTFRVLTRPALAPVFENHPAVSGVVTVGENDMHGAAWARFCLGLARQYGRLPLIDLHVNLRTLVLRTMWPGPVRTYAKLSLTRRLFLATRHPVLADRLRRFNVPQRYALALEKTPPDAAELRPRIFLTESETAAAGQTLARLGLDRAIAIHPYATHPAKTPDADVWREVIRTLEDRGEQVIVLGRSPRPILPGSPRDLTGATDLRATAALLARCRCLVTGDSGPMHLATGVGTPVAAIFGPTTGEWGFHPSGPRDIVHQSPCPLAPCSMHGQDTCTRGNACMHNITGATVLELVDRLKSGE
jgi:ADP-heptose:LPS heptosyltransferase